MKYPTRIYYTEADKSLMWDRWQKGESLNSIARHFGRSHSSIQGILSRTGGIRPAPRRRSRVALTLPEREEISRGVVAGQSPRSIASEIGRAPSTVSREVNRNGGRRHYRANTADQAAWDLAHRCTEATARVGAGADRGLAEVHVPGRRELSGVTRDDLQEPVHPGSRGLEERAPAAPSQDASHASFPSPHAKDGQPWPY